MSTNIMRQKHSKISLAVCSALAMSAFSASSSALADESNNPLGLSLKGYIRGYASWNVDNPIPYTSHDDQGKLSMARASALLDLSGGQGPVRFRFVGRADKEYKTDYLKHLQSGTNAPSGGLHVQSNQDIMDLYDGAEVREAYVDIQATDRINLRIGKQQVVWGESDFFHAMDIVNGFNQLWAPPTEDSDETRKGNMMLNAKIAIPEANGTLQIIVRPGLDRNKDIGNTPDIYGGRNGGIVYRGTTDAMTLVKMDYHHPSGDVNETTGGVRWTGEAGGINYSLAYLKTFTPNFVINSPFVPYQKNPSGPVLGDLIFPTMEVFGVSANGYSETLDAVLSTEVAYQKDVAYNIGTIGPFAGGLGGIARKNQIRSMIRMDKNLDLSFIGAARPSLWSVQIFDTYIQDFNANEQLVLIPTYNHPVKQHETMITNIFSLSYANGNISPTLVAAYDLTNKGGFIIPYVDFAYGNNWRFRVEYDHYYHGKQDMNPTPVDPSLSPTTFGLAAKNDQFWMRATYQF